MVTDIDFYRVQVRKPWWRRKWQAEWDGCMWAQRGYTKRGIRIAVSVRRSHPRVDRSYDSLGIQLLDLPTPRGVTFGRIV